MTPPQVLLLTPGFHSYDQSISRGFEAAGCRIISHRYDTLGTNTEKLKHKLRHELPEKLHLVPPPEFDERASRSAAAAIRRHRPDVVLVIKGDRFDESVHEAMDAAGARRFLWLYDEVRRTRHDEQSLDRYEGLISYSPLDVAAFRASGRECLYVPNAFDPTMQPTPRHTNQVLFIGARYPRRQHLMEALAKAGVPHLAVGRAWSRHPIDRARTWEWARPPVTSTRDIDRLEGYALTAGAPAAINIHGDQDGFTMKTFEVPGVGGVQLVDRDDVSEFYEPGREVLVFHNADELIDLSQRLIADDRWGDRIREAGRARTLAEHTFEHRARVVMTLWG